MAIVYAGSILTVYNLRPYARGDLPGSLSAAARRNFNSRPCTRGDAAPAAPAPPASYFNSRPCTRGDGALSFTPYPISYFNSRPCTRGDGERHPGGAQRTISIHAPARGATFGFVVSPHITVFQFTPLHEGRRKLAMYCYDTDEFQFTPLHEGRRSGMRHSSIQHRFQFTPLHEGRRQKICVQRKSFVQSSQIIAL